MQPPKVLDGPAADMRTKLATAARWARHRPRTNQQGIALQTVIVIVVMLVIAGGVSGVLLSRGTEVISDLETADIGSTCEEISIQDSAGSTLTGVTAAAAVAAQSVAIGDCVFTASNNAATISATQCRSAARALDQNNYGANNVIAAADTCVIDLT